MLAAERLPASPSCVAAVRANASNPRLRRSGAVKILQLESPTANALTGATGKTRLAWTVIGKLPVVQCVDVRRTGNFLTGIHVQLIALSAPIGNEAKFVHEADGDRKGRRRSERKQNGERRLLESAAAMADTTTKLEVNSRAADGSRSARRLRRSGRVPGVLYGGGGEPVGFDVDERELRHALAGSGAVLDLSLDGDKPTPVVLKEAQRHPVRGETIHVDLLRVNLDKAIHAVVPLELAGVEDAPGVKEGGVLEQITREVNVEALPTAIPESIVHEIGEMQIGDTIVLAGVAVPDGVTLLDDPEETIVATLSPPRLQSRGGRGNRSRDGARRRGRGGEARGGERRGEDSSGEE